MKDVTATRKVAFLAGYLCVLCNLEDSLTTFLQFSVSVFPLIIINYNNNMYFPLINNFLIITAINYCSLICFLSIADTPGSSHSLNEVVKEALVVQNFMYFHCFHSHGTNN